MRTVHRHHREASRSERGFTIIELLIVIAISLIVFGATLSISFRTETSAQLNEATLRIQQAIRAARNDSVARFHDNPHGIFFESIATTSDRYTLYEGASYATRDQSRDIVVILEDALTLSTTLPSNDLSFSRSLGVPTATGTVTVTHATIGTLEITVNELGAVDISF